MEARLAAQSCPTRTSAAAGKLDSARAEYRELIVLVVGFLLDLDEMFAVLDELPPDPALDEQHVACRIVSADLATRLAQEAVVADPVRQVMGQPGVSLRTVVIGARRAHLQGEVLLPVNALGYVGNTETVGDADARMRVDQLPCELIGADVQAPPPLRIGDKAGDRHRALEHHRKLFAFVDVLPIAWRRAADRLVAIKLVGFGD